MREEGWDEMPDTIEYKCPRCGGAVIFDVTLGRMKCPFCDTEFEPEELSAEADAGLAAAQPSDGVSAEDYITDGEGLRLYVCDSCGGEIVTDETTAAASCPFCGNPVVLGGNLSGILRPDIVVPFKIDRKTAMEAYANFCRKKPLLPKGFLTESRFEEIKGVYVPFWLYSCDADAELSFRTTRVRSWSDFRYHYTETSYYRVTRAGEIAFDGVPVDGSSKMPDETMESLEPFDWSEAVGFTTAYLSGFFADKYDVTADECEGRARERINSSTVSAISSTVNGYATVSLEDANIVLGDRRVRYGLLPVWMLTTTWRGDKYTFAMNGQTGKFIGKLPLSVGRTAGWFFGIAAAVSAILFVITLLGDLL